MLPEKQFTLHFDDVRLPASALVGDEGQGFRQVFHGLNPERITGAALCVGIARYALGRAARYANEREVWGRPIGAHQGVAHPLAKAQIETELAALMTPQGRAGCTTTGCRRARRRTWRSTPPPRPPSPPPTPRCRPTAATGGLRVRPGAATGASPGSLRIAPVNREMILNFVAQHCLGLPARTSSS